MNRIYKLVAGGALALMTLSIGVYALQSSTSSPPDTSQTTVVQKTKGAVVQKTKGAVVQKTKGAIV